MITPTTAVDLSGSVGAAPNDLMLRLYDETAYRRITVAWGGIEGEGLRVPWAALPAFEAGLAGVGQAQMLLSAPVDLTTTPAGVVLVPAMPGYFFMPATTDPLRVVNISSGGTMSVAPTIRAGNDGGHSNWGSGSLDAEAFVGSTARTTRPALGNGALVTMADLASPIVLDVTAAGSGSGFAWSVRFGIVGSLVAAF
jgi:hypothetical protein